MSELELVSLPDEFSSSETGINTMKIHCTYKRDGEYSGETCGCAEFEFPAGPEPADVNHKPPRQHEIQVMHLPIGEKEGVRSGAYDMVSRKATATIRRLNIHTEGGKTPARDLSIPLNASGPVSYILHDTSSLRVVKMYFFFFFMNAFIIPMSSQIWFPNMA